MDKPLPFKNFVPLQFFLWFVGVALFVIPLVMAGVQQGHSNFAPNAGKFWLMMSTGGLVFLLLGSFLLLVNLFLMTLKWKIALVKTVAAAAVAPLESSEVKP